MKSLKIGPWTMKMWGRKVFIFHDNVRDNQAVEIPSHLINFKGQLTDEGRVSFKNWLLRTKEHMEKEVYGI